MNAHGQEVPQAEREKTYLISHIIFLFKVENRADHFNFTDSLFECQQYMNW